VRTSIIVDGRPGRSAHWTVPELQGVVILVPKGAIALRSGPGGTVLKPYAGTRLPFSKPIRRRETMLVWKGRRNRTLGFCASQFQNTTKTNAGGPRCYAHHRHVRAPTCQATQE
jgi:hypothetical protein